MKRLNDAPILDQVGDDTPVFLMVALWKLVKNQIITVTADDIRAFREVHDGQPTLFLHGHPDSIEVGVVTPARAAAIARHHAAMESKEKH